MILSLRTDSNSPGKTPLSILTRTIAPPRSIGNREFIKDRTRLDTPAASSEAVSKLEIRAEGPPVNRPGRQAGNGFVGKISAEGAAQQRVSRLQRSLNLLSLSRPDGRAY
jgi:hypothetical protein